MSKSLQLGLVVKGVLLAAALALILSLGFGVLLSFTSIPESDLSLSLIFVISIFIAAVIVAHQAGNKGLFYGLAVGFGFIALLIILSLILLPDSPSWLVIGEKAILALTSGGIGGIIGVLFRRA